MDLQKNERRAVLIGALLLVLNFILSIATFAGLLFLIKYLFF